MRPFERFGLDHALGIVFVVLVGWGIQRLGRARPRAVEILLGLSLVAYIIEAYRARWDYLSWDTALPLHLCDVLLLLAIGLLIKPPLAQEPQRSLLFDLIFFGAWGGSVWAFITPDLYVGFPNWRYFEFFFGHGLIFWLLGHFYWNRSCRIWPGAALRAWLWLWGYTLVVGGLDFIFGWNYGYLREKPGAGSVLDAFGPWPLYILVSVMIVGVIFKGMELAVGVRPAKAESMDPSWTPPHS